MPALLLGPLLRYVDENSATVWIEADRPCEVTVVVESQGGDATVTASARTWHVAGHHYALVAVTGLRPATTSPYRLALDGAPVWPLPDSPFPPSTVRTLPSTPGAPGDRTDLDTPGVPDTAGTRDTAGDPGGPGDPSERDPEPLRITFGSCRWACPSSDRHSKRNGPVGPDALDTLAGHLATDPEAQRPDVLLLLGDQVYADETSVPVREYLAARRAPGHEPRDQVADYEEYTRLYHESWLDPEIRWLLSTVPSLMIFDDHDVIDDWNTSESWREEMRATDWWPERILSGFASYWVHQHLGNLSPDELADDKLYAAVRSADDGAEVLRAFAERADADPSYVRWSYRRDFGRVRLLMVDTRAARVLEEGRRAMLDPSQMSWLVEQATDGAVDHLLIGSSLPWLLPQAIHDAESWNASLCAGRRGPRWARLSEKVRRAADLEHWAAFRSSFDELAGLFARVGAGPSAPATICVLSGDVHHAYVAEARYPEQLTSRVLQLTCSPVHNAVPAAIKAGFRFGWGRTARSLGRLLARHGKVPRLPLGWRKVHGPYFGNQLMTFSVRGRGARLRLARARLGPPGDDRARLHTTVDTALVGDDRGV